jgi:MFS transporter, DHA2 family, multidrug resistance protein
MAEPAVPAAPAPRPYSGGMLALLTFVLAMANMMEVLDLTIANVSIPTITGDLAVSPNQGTWVITSYAIANAITVPMTGWFAQRYGQVRVFTLAIALFTGASLLCALSTSLEMLIAFRILQGAVAGFMVPLSQALLMASFPPEKRGVGLAIWAMTIVVAPIIGPILGGWITESYHWSWIFLINIPVGIFASLATWQLMKDRETPTRKLPIDGVGIALLIVWVGALQLMLDKGNELDWFHSGLIQACAVVAALGFALFIAWELTDDHPVVDLGVFRYPNFRRGALTLSLGFSLFFANIVILPLWLQTQMGYTSLWAGFALAPAGILAVLFSPFVGIQLGKGTDPRLLATVGFITFTVVFLWRAHFNTGADFVTIALPQLLQGVGIAFFFAPLISINLGGIPNWRIANATGLQNFLRMMAGSFGASLAVTYWDQRTSMHRTQLVDHVSQFGTQTQDFLNQLTGAGLSLDQAYAYIERQLTGQASMLAANDIFWFSGWTFVLLIAVLWTTRPPFSAPAGAH